MIFVDLKNRTAEKAINGDCDAQILMLKRYERYINKVSMVTKKDRFGNLADNARSVSKFIRTCRLIYEWFSFV